MIATGQHPQPPPREEPPGLIRASTIEGLIMSTVNETYAAVCLILVMDL